MHARDGRCTLSILDSFLSTAVCEFIKGPAVIKEDSAYAGSHVNWSSFKDQEAEEAALRDGACFYLFQLQNSHITSQSM
ncbi:hypothetical protein R1flu_001659 [Riccia fluitans]|uniref:Uncharacterized protein n=1 Tax=Riccia fluitans TaxID=41844 RepID=A0ABD1Y7W2_9MARC